MSAGVGIEPVQMSHVPLSAVSVVTGVIPYPTVFVILEMIARTAQSASTRLQVLHMVNFLAIPATKQDTALEVSPVPALLPMLGAVVSSSKAVGQTHWPSNESAFSTSALMLTAAGHLIQTAEQIVGEGGPTTSAYTVGEDRQQQLQQQASEEDSTDQHKQQRPGDRRMGVQSKQQQVAWRHLEAAAQQWLREMRPALRLDGGWGQGGQSLDMEHVHGLKEHFWYLLWAGLHLGCHAADCCTGKALPKIMADALGRVTSEVEKTLQRTLARAAGVLGHDSGAVLQAVKELQDGGAESLGCFARMVLSMVPVGFCCNNPDCRELGGLSELGLVQGPKGARGVCGGCGLACYCSRECQEKVWCAHGNACKQCSW